MREEMNIQCLLLIILRGSNSLPRLFPYSSGGIKIKGGKRKNWCKRGETGVNDYAWRVKLINGITLSGNIPIFHPNGSVEASHGAPSIMSLHSSEEHTLLVRNFAYGGENVMEMSQDSELHTCLTLKLLLASHKLWEPFIREFVIARGISVLIIRRQIQFKKKKKVAA